MKISNELKRGLILVVTGVTLFALLMNLSAVLGFFGWIAGLLTPIIAGFILAMFMNVPVNGINKLLTRAFARLEENSRRKVSAGKKKKAFTSPKENVIHIISFVITAVIVALVLTLVLTLLIPELVGSVESIYDAIILKIDEINSGKYEGEWLVDLLAMADWQSILRTVANNVQTILTGIISSVSSIVGLAVTGVFALIISIYVVLGKKGIGNHTKKLIEAYLKPSASEKIMRVSRMFADTFAKFLSGQCTEALILGVLMSLAFLVFGLPYAALTGVLTAVCALIPYVGAVLSCVIIAFLTLIVEPTMVIRCVLVYLVVQFIENQLIYPRVVGDSVGLPALYTLIAAMIGGELFGIVGILFFIPLTAVLLELVKADAKRRIEKRNADINDNTNEKASD